MKYFVIYVGLLFVGVNYVFAQESIGFSEPEDIQPILDYRLPDWGYNRFYLDFSTAGEIELNRFTGGESTISNDFERERRSANVGLDPNYRLYRESEERILHLYSSADINYSNNRQEEETAGGLVRLSATADITGSLRKYFSGKHFLYGQTNNALFYRKRSSRQFNSDDDLVEEDLFYDRSLEINPRLGYGFGRVRNVNPLIRAARLQERALSIDEGFNLSAGDIQSAAKQMSRYSGYREIYDRPEKYFWEEMNDITAADFDALSAYNTLYLTDVLDEAIGTRYEGWEIIGGIEYVFRDDLRREEDTVPAESLDRTYNSSHMMGHFINGRWYKNTSMHQQWGVLGDITFGYPISQDEDETFNLAHSWEISAGVEWLWNMTDRVLIQSSLSNTYIRERMKTNEAAIPESNYDEWENRLVWQNSLSYFLENKIMFSLNFNPSLIHSEISEVANRRRFISLPINAGIRYYFNRQLY